MKELSLVITGLIILAILVIPFVLASWNEDENYIYLSYPFHEGWNLVWWPLGFSVSADSDITDEDAIALFMYDSVQQKYARAKPETSEWRRLDSMVVNDEWTDEDYRKYMATPCMWVYMRKSGNWKTYVSKYSRIGVSMKDIDFIPSIYLKKGWNFIGVVPIMVGYSINDIKGDCNMEKLYVWDGLNQKWVKFSPSESIYRDDVGAALVIKTTSDCKLGSPITPPPLP